MRRRRQTPDDFWARADRGGPDECWPWNGVRGSKGYGMYQFSGATKQHTAHRTAWELSHAAQIPDGLYVCHHCDNPPCVNPAHLFVGTAADNSQDMWRKGRGRKPKQSAPWFLQLMRELQTERMVADWT